MKTLSAVIIILVATHAPDAQVYHVQVYDGFDAGWSMDEGTITTSGFVGTIDETSNIAKLFTDWSISFTSPQGSFSFTPRNSEFTAVDSATFNTIAVVDVDPQYLHVPFTPSSVDLILTSAAGQSILWDGPRFSGTLDTVALLGSVELTDGVSSSMSTLGACFIADTGCPELPADLLIGYVPEPAFGVSLMLWIGVALSRYRHHRNLFASTSWAEFVFRPVRSGTLLFRVKRSTQGIGSSHHKY